jgi:hypothetical protein
MENSRSALCAADQIIDQVLAKGASKFYSDYIDCKRNPFAASSVLKTSIIPIEVSKTL